VERGNETESVHLVHGVIVGLEPGLEVRFGDPDLLSYWRSAMKPFQALPVVADGAAERFDLDPQDLALCCASHHGTIMHVERVMAMLARLGLDEEALACGPHPPFNEIAANQLFCEGVEPGRLHNNCSGKHTGMLAVALCRGWSLDGYDEPGHPVQVRIQEELRDWLDVDPVGLTWATDGCGVPTPLISLRDMALAYARLVRSERQDVRSVVKAMTENPEYVSGPGALSTDVMKVTQGRILAKEGAEGVFCVAGCGQGWGAAVKVSDGNKRAVSPALVAMLGSVGLIDQAEAEQLAAHHHPALKNTQGRVVGRMVVEARSQRAAVLRQP
jgi:L-asparaginase II